MNKRLIVPLIFGIGGFAILIGLGNWQMRRLAWKNAVIAEIERRIAEAPVAVPADPVPDKDRYRPVTFAGRPTGKEVHVLTSIEGAGAGYRVIAAIEEDSGRRLLVELGFLRQADKSTAATTMPITGSGNIHWPDEVDGFTPEPDLVNNIWFARDVPVIAQALDAEPFLIVSSTLTGTARDLTAMPVKSSAIKNDHLEYALTWYLLAAVWAGMTGYLVWRIRREKI